MAEEGGAVPAVSGAGGGQTSTTEQQNQQQQQQGQGQDARTRLSKESGHYIEMPPCDRNFTIHSPVFPETPNYFSRKNTSIDVEDYFTGPRDIQKHSKWPFVLQMHGSILPKLIVPLACVGAWATCVTVISQKVYELGVQSILLTVLGFVVGLGLSFRSSTAYERYAEGRRYWAQLILASQTLGRVFWLHAKDHDDIPQRQMVLRRVSCLNLLLTFAVSLKHKLRHEPYTSYEDLRHLVAPLDTFAGAATAADPDAAEPPAKNPFKEVGEYLGISFAESNPRKALKKAQRPLGNLPLEIISHLALAIDDLCVKGQLPVPMQQTMAYNNLTIFNDVLTGTERVLSTPLPIAYKIAIAQITWVYVMLLPFQLHLALGWITIPATIAASYIILGILFIGKEIEDPFGNDVNDLPLEYYCDQIAHELDVIAAAGVNREEPFAFVESMKNMPLYPVSMAPYSVWAERSDERVSKAVKEKPEALFRSRKKRSNGGSGDEEGEKTKKGTTGLSTSTNGGGDQIV